MKHFIILIDRLYSLDGERITIGGIQTYLSALSKVIHDNFGVKAYIYQSAQRNFEIEAEHFIVRGVDTQGKINPKQTMNAIKERFSPADTLLIWGSDQYSLPQNTFKSINIQHGIGFDTEAMHTPIKKLMVNAGFTWLYKLMQRYKAIKIFENTSAAVCVDYNFLNWYRTFRSSKQISKDVYVIPNFTDIPDAPFAKSGDRIKIVFARRFVARRGVDIAIPLARYLVEKYENVEFHFAGDGPKKQAVEALAQSHERILMTRFESSKSLEFHSDYAIALVPSVGSEGTSLSLLEAMASNCAVVASNVGGMTNIVLNQFNGSLVPPTLEAFKAEVTSLIENREKLKEYQNNGFKTVKQAFSKSKWESEWVNVIRSVLK
ncbi:hypothetical protein PRUB_a2932 [Pseudoalteromonas rubra]|uniref:Glycosyl transferase family 1 domain-containing protein n=1 Tax=Pseudoalteromonas rubra TaxID=43658 RepID=A0A8T0CC88_9GAMM|nr:glycosyltransferase family 4 protein [Pseudoalteromonas rubra]KAF7788306.1 hypothetical protein PRUB_a2932 [Pseudoalteromonas rubra]